MPGAAAIKGVTSPISHRTLCERSVIFVVPPIIARTKEADFAERPNDHPDCWRMGDTMREPYNSWLAGPA